MYFTLKFLQKPSLPAFSMVHLLHRLYGVDAPVCTTVMPAGRDSDWSAAAAVFTAR